MNVLLQNMYEQPSELKRVLDDLCGSKLETVRTICAQMQASDKIVLTSMGSAYYSLMPMYEALLASGQRGVRLVETADLIYHPERINKDALYILMSRSGESREVADFSGYLKQNGCRSVAVTMTPDSTMATNCDTVLHNVSSYDAIVCIKAYSTLALCGLFCASMIGRSEPDAGLVQKLHDSFDWMEREKERLLADVEAIPYFEKSDGFYMLSRGFGINMMRSGSLWIEEVAKVMSNVMSIDNFFHGPMEIIRSRHIVEPVTTPVFLDMRADARSAMIWDKINEAVPDSICIGPEIKPELSSGNEAEETGTRMSGGVCLAYPTFGLPEAYTAFPIALYLQFISYCCARAKGIEPGMFFDEGWVVQ